MLFRSQYFTFVLQDAGGRHHVIFGDADADQVVAKFQSELTAPQVLLVLPAVGVGEGHEPRKPLGDLVNVIPIFFKMLAAGAATDHVGIIDLIIPIDFEFENLAWWQRLRQVDAHHRLDDSVR